MKWRRVSRRECSPKCENRIGGLDERVEGWKATRDAESSDGCTISAWFSVS
jgi:hypothetical protein